MTDVDYDNALREALRALATDRHDEDAWRVLFQRAWPFMVAVCARLGADVHAAQEAAQESLIRIARYAPFDDLVEPDAFRAYARVVCRRIAHARYRKQGANLLLPIDKFELASDDLDPEQEASTRTLLDTILRELEPHDQRLLQMTIAGYSLAEIARELTISDSAAGVRLHRIRRRLRKWLSHL